MNKQYDSFELYLVLHKSLSSSPVWFVGENSISQRREHPEANAALKKMRNEIAAELELNVPNDDYWGNVPSKDCGRVGGLIDLS